MVGELGGGGGLARTLEADQHDGARRRGGEGQGFRLAAEHLGQVVIMLYSRRMGNKF